MAEKSRFWTTNNTGDGPTSGYTAADFYDFVRRLFITDQETSQGALRGVGNELAVSGSASPLSVADGAAICYGLFYENSAPLNLAVATPLAGPTGGRVNLLVDWSSQTVRAAVQLNTDGIAAIPALVQVAGSTWSIPLATFTVNPAGSITLADARSFCRFASYLTESDLDFLTGLSVVGNPNLTTGPSSALAAAADGQVMRRAGNAIGFGTVGADSIADGAITDAKLRDSAALSVIGRSAGTPGAPADIMAGADDQVLSRAGGTVAFRALTAAMIAAGAIGTTQLQNDSVDDAKAGNRVVQVRRRQGGNAADWSIAGITNYTPGMVRSQPGRTSVAFSNELTKSVTITFPEAFSQPPILILQAVGIDQLGNVVIASAYGSIITTTGAYVAILVGAALTGSVLITWLAIGPE